MNINTGLLFKKPGESFYSKFRRFLIANNCQALDMRGFTEILKQQIPQNDYVFSDKKYPLRCLREPNKYNVDALSILALRNEYYFSQNNNIKTTNIDPPSTFSRPLKCCSECMKLGFHSDIFDFDWLNRCPIHKIMLSEQCSNCKRKWASYSMLLNRKCTECGTDMNIENVIKNTVFKDSSSFEIFTEIEKIVNKNQDFILPEITLYDLTCKSIEPTNHNQKFTNSAIFSYLRVINKLSSKECSQLKKTGIQFINFKHKKYKLKPATFQFSNFKINQKLIDDMNKIRKSFKLKVKILLNRYISNNHSIGICKDEIDACVYCSIWYFWKALNQKIKYRKLYNHILRDYDQLKNIHLNNYFGAHITMPIFRTHISLKNKNKPRSEDYFYLIPKHLQILLYKTEMFESLVSVINFIRNFEKLIKEVNRPTWGQVKKLEEENIYYNKCSIPIYINNDKGEFSAFFPEALSDVNHLLNQDNLINLMENIND